jgi:hypothetical protein
VVVTVRLEVAPPVSRFGLKLAVALAGKPVAASVTCPLKLFCSVMLTL